MEGSHRQLGTGLTDGLCGDDADCLTDLHHLTGRHVGAVALCADAKVGAAGQDRADLDRGDLSAVCCNASGEDRIGAARGDHVVLLDKNIAIGVPDLLAGDTARDAVVQGLDNFLALCELPDHHAGDLGSVLRAVDLTDDELLGDIDHSSCEVAGVCGTQSRIGHTLSGSVGGHEVLQDVQTFTEVRGDGQLDRAAGGIGHQASHAGQLLDLLVGSAGTGIRHHEDVVVLIERLQQGIRQAVIDLGPGLDDSLVALLVGHEAAAVVLCDLVDRCLALCQKVCLLPGHRDVGDGDGERSQRGLLVAHGLDLVQNLCAGESAVLVDDLLEDLLQIALLDHEVDLGQEEILRLRAVDKAKILRNRLVEHQASEGGVDHAAVLFAVPVPLRDADFDLGLQGDEVVCLCHVGLVDAAKAHALSGLSVTLLRDEVDAQDHILCRNRDGAAVGGLQQVVRGQEHEPALCLCLDGQRQMDSHLVAIEVGVECGAGQRMELDGLALDQNRLEGLDAQTVQGGCTVEHDGVLLDDILEDVPDHRVCLLDELLCVLDVLGDAPLLQLLHDEGLEELEGHDLRDAALIDLHLRADDDNGTAGVVDTLAEQVLTEASVLTLEHVRQGL